MRVRVGEGLVGLVVERLRLALNFSLIFGVTVLIILTDGGVCLVLWYGRYSDMVGAGIRSV